MAAPHHEPTVRSSAPMPPGYTFVPKGNVYITSHCRKQTQAAAQTVFLVAHHADANANANAKRPIGIRVPAAILASVRAAHDATRDARAEAVRRRDAKLEAEFRAAVLARFPRAPPASLDLVVQRAMRKGSRRVGRAGSEGLALEDKAVLAVRAHIRHAHTEYDALLRGGGAVTREKARAETYERIDEVVRLWGGAPSKPKPKPKPKPKKSKPQRGGGKGDRSRERRGKSGRAAAAATATATATVTRVEKPARGSPGRPGKAAAADSASRLRREKKQVVRRARATGATRDESPEVQREAVQMRTRSGLGYSLRDVGDSESDEYEWSSWDEDSDNEDDTYDG